MWFITLPPPPPPGTGISTSGRCGESVSLSAMGSYAVKQRGAVVHTAGSQETGAGSDTAAAAAVAPPAIYIYFIGGVSGDPTRLRRW